MNQNSDIGPLGILLLDTAFPRGKGDIGNPGSYDFPVMIKTVSGANVERVVIQSDPTLVDLFIAAGLEAQEEGACAVTTSCGFMAPFQADVAKALKIPVFLSSLPQIPLAYMMTQRRIGVLTANGETLTERHLSAAGVPADLPMSIRGLNKNPAFYHWIYEDGPADHEAIQQAMLDAAHSLLEEDPNLGAIVCECHNMAPYAPAVATATGLPVFDVISYAHWVYRTLKKREFLTL
ncbi:aspartate/glutamate racemase family protein [Chloroflexi bacterium TSY]|nr:aspartate/glutamate racemase family protein [Chloroflexi bacterium TSY]